MTYAELIAKIQTWWESDETAFLAEVDTFIEFAEKRIYRSVDLNITKTTALNSLAIVENNRNVGLPSTFVTFRMVALQDASLNNLKPLLQKDMSFINDYAPNKFLLGEPKYYAVFDSNTLVLAPTPDATTALGTLYLDYTTYPAQLSSSNTTTWLSENAPDLLFYACMLEVMTFQKAEEDTMADYKAKYEQAIQGVLLEQNMRNRTDEYRNGEIRMEAPQ